MKGENMNSKDVVTAIKKDDSLVIHRLSEDVYWVGSVYALTKMNTTEFNEFRSKYNSYRSTPDIPFQIEIDEPIGFKEGDWLDHGPDVRPIIQEPARHDNLRSIFITNFKFTQEKREIVLYTVDGVIGAYNDKYSRIIK